MHSKADNIFFPYFQTIDTEGCPNIRDPQCNTDQIECHGGIDEDGCEVQPICINVNPSR